MAQRLRLPFQFCCHHRTLNTEARRRLGAKWKQGEEIISINELCFDIGERQVRELSIRLTDLEQGGLFQDRVLETVIRKRSSKPKAHKAVKSNRQPKKKRRLTIQYQTFNKNTHPVKTVLFVRILGSVILSEEGLEGDRSLQDLSLHKKAENYVLLLPSFWSFLLPWRSSPPWRLAETVPSPKTFHPEITNKLV